MFSNRLINSILFFFLAVNSSSLAAQKLTAISTIQGTTNTTPLLGKTVEIEGIVTADFQEDKSFSGFFIQSQSVKNRSSASSGIFVYESRIVVNIGDLVRVSGTVEEFRNVTQIARVKSIKVLKQQQKLPQAMAIHLPINGFDFESLEGMRVTLDQAALITDHFNYIKYGELTVSSQLLMSPTNSIKAGPKVNQLKQQNADDRLLIDDGSFGQFPNYTQINNKTPVYIGAKVQVVGIMHYAFDKYRVEITEPIEFLASDFPQRSQPQSIAGDLKIGSFNLRNYFTTLDKGKNNCGPKQNFGCRGADSPQELIRQQNKIVQAINTANADVFALEELENTKNALKALVAELNKDSKTNKWDYIKTGTLGEDVIRVGLIYQIKNATPKSNYKILDPKSVADFEADKHRDVLVQTFEDSDHNLFNVAVLHLKSKRCSDAKNADTDQNDGQGCYNASRAKVALQISHWLNKDPTDQNAPVTIVAGDFNSYVKEDPIHVFHENGFINLTPEFLNAENWTSIYRGVVGSIDHILVNKSARKTAKGLTQWHINSSVIGWFDYNLEPLAKSKNKPKSYYKANPIASSDHDIVIAGFTFSEED